MVTNEELTTDGDKTQPTGRARTGTDNTPHFRVGRSRSVASLHAAGLPRQSVIIPETWLAGALCARVGQRTLLSVLVRVLPREIRVLDLVLAGRSWRRCSTAPVRSRGDRTI